MDRTGRLCSHLRGGMLPVFRILPSAKTHNKKMDAMLNGKKIFRCQMFGIQIIYRHKNFDMFI